MANWSFTRGRMDTGYRATEQLIWENHYTVTEETADQAGKIKLTISVKTDYFWYTWGGTDGTAGTTTDYVEYNGQRVKFSENRTRAKNYEYSATFYVDFSWNKKNITFHVCDRNDTAYLNATAANPSTITASAGYFGQGIPITLTNAVTDVKHTVTVSCGGQEETLLTNDSAKSVTWTPNLATYAALITSAASAEATITCTTYYAGTSMGSSTKTITVSFLASDVGPTKTTGWASVAVLNEFTNAITGSSFTVWISGYSKARASFDSSKITLGTGASISKYSVKYNTVTTDVTPPNTTGDTGIITGTSATVTCTVTDSRGFTASEDFSITLLGYSAPSMTGQQVIRASIENSTIVEDDGGNYFAIQATAVYTSLSTENSYELRVFVREMEQAYSGDGYTFSSAALDIIRDSHSDPVLFDPDVSYEVKLQIKDGLNNTVVMTFIRPSRAWAMKFRPTGDGVAFGKAPGTGSANAKLLEIGPGWKLRIWSSDGTTYEDLDYTALHGLLQ